MCGDVFCQRFSLLSQQFGIPVAKQIMGCLAYEWAQHLRMIDYDLRLVDYESLRKLIGPFTPDALQWTDRFANAPQPVHQISEFFNLVKGSSQLFSFVVNYWFHPDPVTEIATCGCISRRTSLFLCPETGKVTIKSWKGTMTFDSFHEMVLEWMELAEEGHSFCALVDSEYHTSDEE